MMKKKLIFAVIFALTYIPAFSQFANSEISKEIVSYESTVTVSYMPHNGMLITGLVKNMAGDPLPAYIRIFNKVRTQNHVDVFAQTYANIKGEFSIEMPVGKAAGEYEVIIYRGPEYEYFSVIADIKENGITNLNINLARITDMASEGWYGGEVHQHSKRISNYGSDGVNTIEEMAEANAAAGLHFGVLTDHNQTSGTGNNIFITEGKRYGVDSGNLKFLPFSGCEVTTAAGHFNVWNPRTEAGGHYFISYFVNTASAENKLNDVSKIADDINSHSLLSVINHPTHTPLGFIESDFDWLQNKELTLKFDAVEVWNGFGFIGTWAGNYGSIPYFGVENDPAHIDYTNNRTSNSFIQWYKLLNSGVKFPAVGGSDSHNRNGTLEGNSLDQLIEQVRNANSGVLPAFNSPEETSASLTPLIGYASAFAYLLKDYQENYYENMGGIPGMPRIYVHIGNKEFTQENIAQAVKNGNSFITNGPLIKAAINGMIPGETADVTNEQVLSLDILCNRSFNRIQVIADGKLVKTIDTGEVTSYKNTITVPELKEKKWAIVYVEGGDNFQFAFTNPVYFYQDE